MTTAGEYLNTLTGHFYSPCGAQQVKELASVLRGDADFADLGRPLESQYEAQSSDTEILNWLIGNADICALEPFECLNTTAKDFRKRVMERMNK